MKNRRTFDGFSRKTLGFLENLKKNNTKSWFDDNKSLYTDCLMAESVSFVVDMGNKLKELSPNIVADPRRDKSIFRLNKDVRFSKDKTPYKTHVGIFFWEGAGKKLENPGYYFHFESKKILFGVGLHMIPKQYLDLYRKSVVDTKYGSELKKIIQKISKNKNYKLGWPKYKKVPRGYDKDHPNAEYLLYGGIGFLYETKIPKEFYSKDFIDYSFNIFKDLSPINNWLVDIIRRSSAN